MDRKIIEEKFNRGCRMADAALKVMRAMNPDITQSKTKILIIRFHTMDDAYLIRCIDGDETRYEFCIHFPEDGDKVRAYQIPPETDIIGFIRDTLACFDDTPKLLSLGED